MSIYSVDSVAQYPLQSIFIRFYFSLFYRTSGQTCPTPQTSNYGLLSHQYIITHAKQTYFAYYIIIGNFMELYTETFNKPALFSINELISGNKNYTSNMKH